MSRRAGAGLLFFLWLFCGDVLAFRFESFETTTNSFFAKATNIVYDTLRSGMVYRASVTNQVILSTNIFPTVRSNFTLSCWVFLSETSVFYGVPAVVLEMGRELGAGAGRVALGLQRSTSATSGLNLQPLFLRGSTWWSLDSPNTGYRIPVGKWTMLTSTFSLASGVRVYVNGLAIFTLPMDASSATGFGVIRAQCAPTNLAANSLSALIDSVFYGVEELQAYDVERLYNYQGGAYVMTPIRDASFFENYRDTAFNIVYGYVQGMSDAVVQMLSLSAGLIVAGLLALVILSSLRRF